MDQVASSAPSSAYREDFVIGLLSNSAHACNIFFYTFLHFSFMMLWLSFDAFCATASLIAIIITTPRMLNFAQGSSEIKFYAKEY